MTDTKNAAQPVLTDDEILAATLYGQSEARMIRNGRAIESAVLSKLRAPVADEGALPPCALQTVGWDGAGIVEYFTADQMRAAMASAPVGIPAGWRLVPITPTPEMESAGCDVPFGQDDAPAPATVYAAMIDAAPAASAPVVSQRCPTDVCQAAKADGVLCADDECDRSNGVRPASAPVAAPVWNDDYKHDVSMFQPRDQESAPVAGEAPAEQLIQAAIDQAPEPLRRLGEYLSRVLDEDQWATAERMLLGTCDAAPQASEADGLIDALGQCRDAFPIPDKVGSKLDLLWQEAMSDPTAVPEYVKLCAALSAQPGAQRTGGSDAE